MSGHMDQGCGVLPLQLHNTSYLQRMIFTMRMQLLALTALKKQHKPSTWWH